MSETAFRLPVLGSEPSCLDCATACCYEYFVPVNNYDLWRMVTSLGLTWTQLCYAAEELALYNYSFRLDSSARRFSLRLYRRPSGACQFLLQLPNKLQRCGIHGARPQACRQYPFRNAPKHESRVDFISHAVCPAPQKAAWDTRRGEMADDVVDEAAELELSIRAMKRWDVLAEKAPPHQPRLVREYADWILGLYATLEPLRVGARAEWEPAVIAAIDAFPLPEDFSSGS